MQKIAVGVEYNGAAFRGWQSQPGGGTAQDAVEAALSRVAGGRVAVYAAGRTDAGAHASLMTAHFAAPVLRQPSAWTAGANAALPPAAKLLWARPVRGDFHARHRALRRYYQYILLNRAARPAIMAQHAGFCHAPLDMAAMRLAAAHLRGEHDFSAFRAAACQARAPVRRLFDLTIRRADDVVIFDFCGDGFLHHMVRNIVGALLVVGRHRRPPEWMRELLDARDRRLAAPTAAAAGLYFCGARYDAAFNLPEYFRPALPVIPAPETADAVI